MFTEPYQAVDQLLYGADSTPGIVAVHVDRSTAEPVATLYRRDTQDEVFTEEHRLYPFFLLDKIGRLSGFHRDRYQYQDLRGENHFKYVVVFETWNDYYDAMRLVEHESDLPLPPLFNLSNPVQQYLLQSGKTLFKGLELEGVRRLQLDIEVLSHGSFPSASRREDEVIIVALSDSTGWERLIHSMGSERALLSETVRVIQQRDPDVIEGHNVFRFDLTYLRDRCKLLGVHFGIGRDRSAPRVFKSSMRFAERSFEYPAFEIAGRHVIDTFLLSMSYDVFKRDLPGYGLKAVARHFGFAAPQRVYIPGDQISATWTQDPQRVLEYAMDDVRETGKIARHLCGSSFYLSQMLPMNYQDVARTGPGIKIETLMIREYLRKRHSVPAAREIGEVTGAYTDVFVTGVAGPIVYADVESLYPSIMLQHEIRPSTDTLNVFSRLLDTLTQLRFSTKEEMQRAPDRRHQDELDARQSSYKTLINAFYGYLGFGRALFNDSSEADRVTRTGQEVLHTIISLIVRAGGTVVEVDTDGVFFVPPPDVDDQHAEQAFVDRLNDQMPPRIRISIDGRFAKMLSYKIKNYILLDYANKLTFKGSSLVSRSTERFGRRFVRKCVRLLFEDDIAGLHQHYLSVRDKVLNHDWRNVESFSRTETIKTTLEQYETDVARGKRSRSAAYEVAINRSNAIGRVARVGDRISYYITGQGSAVTAFANARDAALWSPESPDENTEYYLRRLDEFASKFEPFFTNEAFRMIFSPEDLFGFSDRGIRVLTTSRPPVRLD
ncbi:MAG: DNA polymerase [Rhodothermales bacterium]|nr:DNA polymerase [Rhodothermales bacterium]